MRKESLAIVSIIALAMGLIVACSTVGEYVDIVRYKGLSEGYLSELKKWTRTQTVYSQFETKATITATYRGRSFSDAFNREYARIYNLTPEEATKKEGVAAEGLKDFREFFFYAYLPDKEANDFDRYNSVWKVYLVDGRGQRCEPAEIRKVDKVTPVMEDFFPYVQKYYGICYRLRFPVVEGQEGDIPTRPFRLVFTGVIGQLELSWK